MRGISLALLIAGCAPGTFVPRAGQAEAERIVWNNLYGMTGAAPPVEWMLIGTLPGGYGGATIIGSHIEVCIGDPATTEAYPTISATAFAHELLHYAEWVRTGDVDALHWRANWDLADRVAPNELGKAGL